MLIDGFDRAHPLSARGTGWELVTDGVMGGVSSGRIARETVAGRSALRLTGAVRLENDGGFVQAALDLAPNGGAVDLSAAAGIALDVFGNGQSYDLRLRTTDLRRPWQSFRAPFVAEPAWKRVEIPFADLVAHRTEAGFDPARVRRLGLVAIGRAFDADLAVARIATFG